MALNGTVQGGHTLLEKKIANVVIPDTSDDIRAFPVSFWYVRTA